MRGSPPLSQTISEGGASGNLVSSKPAGQEMGVLPDYCTFLPVALLQDRIWTVRG